MNTRRASGSTVLSSETQQFYDGGQLKAPDVRFSHHIWGRATYLSKIIVSSDLVTQQILLRRCPGEGTDFV